MSVSGTRPLGTKFKFGTFLVGALALAACRDRKLDESKRAELTAKITTATEGAKKKDAAFVAAVRDLARVTATTAECPIHLPSPRTSAQGGSFGSMQAAIEAGQAAMLLSDGFAIADAAHIGELHSRRLGTALMHLKLAQEHIADPMANWPRVTEEVDKASSLDWDIEVLIVPRTRELAIADGAGHKTAGAIEGRGYVFDHDKGRFICIAEISARGPSVTEFSVATKNGVPLGEMMAGSVAASNDLKAVVLREVAEHLKACR